MEGLTEGSPLVYIILQVERGEQMAGERRDSLGLVCKCVSNVDVELVVVVLSEGGRRRERLEPRPFSLYSEQHRRKRRKQEKNKIR